LVKKPVGAAAARIHRWVSLYGAAEKSMSDLPSCIAARPSTSTVHCTVFAAIACFLGAARSQFFTQCIKLSVR
jgi:hypothetical protein